MELLLTLLVFCLGEGPVVQVRKLNFIFDFLFPTYPYPVKHQINPVHSTSSRAFKSTCLCPATTLDRGLFLITWLTITGFYSGPCSSVLPLVGTTKDCELSRGPITIPHSHVIPSSYNYFLFILVFFQFSNTRPFVPQDLYHIVSMLP